MNTKLNTSFFTKDKSFYKSFFALFIMIAMQNLIAYSVNMADNIMLGAYSQNALSGAATVNQIFFVVQQLSMAIGEALVTISSQYWGKKELGPVKNLTLIATFTAFLFGAFMLLCTTLFDKEILSFFTTDAGILAEGIKYLEIIKFTFVLFAVTHILIASLRSVETVKISFYISVSSLFINCIINYVLIYGKLGFPEMGIRGAAIGTLISRISELLIVLWYLKFKDKKIKLFESGFTYKKELKNDYFKMLSPIFISQILWCVSVPVQTAVLGHISSDAIAANSVATTFYQYLKVLVVAMSSASAVMIGTAIGKGEMDRIKSDSRSLSVMDIALGLVLGGILFALRKPLLSFYNLSDSALLLSDQLIVVMSVVMVGMSYQMPVSSGIIRGGGDAKFTLYMNLISVWFIVFPLSLLAAFYFKWPVPVVVLCLQSDQIFKGMPTFLRFRTYKWIKKLTR